jgi:multiple sugar transport system ATP-binding protein
LATLSLEGVGKVYDNGVEAVHDLTLHVDDGEFVVLVGPSGCGKTTALRMVAGLEEITSGDVLLGGRIVNDLSARDRDVAMVFQNYALYPHLSVHDNIAFSLEMRGVSKAERKRRVQEAAEVLGLTEVLDRRPRQLSGGQRQRVAMGRALVREPAVFLMDEPLSNLDAQLRVQMRTEVLRVQRRLGVATLYVTHDQTEAMTMGDRVAILRDGVLQQLAAPQDLYDNPSNLFVASFMGSPAMNLYDAVVEANGDTMSLKLGTQEIVLPREQQRKLPFGGPVVVGIRPEHLAVVPDASASSFAADVELVEALGNEQLVHFLLDAAPAKVVKAAVDPTVSAGTIAASTGIARVDPGVDVAASSRVSLAVDPKRIHFFDRQTGGAIV